MREKKEAASSGGFMSMIKDATNKIGNTAGKRITAFFVDEEEEEEEKAPVVLSEDQEFV